MFVEIVEVLDSHGFLVDVAREWAGEVAVGDAPCDGDVLLCVFQKDIDRLIV